MIALPEGPKLLSEFAEKCKIPTTTTVQGLGGFDELRDLSLHMIGMHGAPYANLAIQEADLIIALVSKAARLLALPSKADYGRALASMIV